jgi:hypothetical protein
MATIAASGTRGGRLNEGSDGSARLEVDVEVPEVCVPEVVVPVKVEVTVPVIVEVIEPEVIVIVVTVVVVDTTFSMNCAVACG